VSSAVQFYVTILLIYLGVDAIACLALNLQFGVTGLVNFGFILFQAAGAYTAAVLTLGPSSANGGYQQYIGGASLPFPLPLLAAAIVGALLSLLVGLVGLRRLRTDYQAIVLLAVSLIGATIATNQVGLFNGASGLSLVPHPLADVLNLDPISYAWVYVAITMALFLLTWLLVHRITSSPLGRTLRSVRESEAVAASVGKNVIRLKLTAYVLGGAIAAVSGALLVEFITAWSPSSWLPAETFVYFAAVIVGGAGNNLGAIVGAALVPVAFIEASQYIPAFGRPGLIESVQWIVIGLLIAVFLWVRPAGIFPERRRRYAKPHPAGDGAQTPQSEPVLPSG
jgi:branched-chain amino acid transport system permease protein